MPCEGVVYAQVVECQLADHWNRIASMSLGESSEDVLEFRYVLINLFSLSHFKSDLILADLLSTNRYPFHYTIFS